MQEHPVPQNVTNFQFKLIGDMTLRQFGYVASGLIIALVAFFAKTNILVINIVRYILIVVPPLTGFALAFLPIEGRPLDRWLVAFMRAVFGNTLYVWKKEGVHYSVLENLTTATSTSTPGSSQRYASAGPRRMVRATPVIRNRLDQEEASLLAHVTGPVPQAPMAVRPATQARPMPLAGPSRPMPLAPQAPRPVVGFAGAVSQNLRMPAPRLAQTQQTVSAMRLPHQRPLAPRRIPSPSYTVAQAQPIIQSPMPEHFSGIKVYPHAAQTATVNQPQMVTFRPPAAQRFDTKELDQLKQQNTTLFQELATIKASMASQAHLPHQTGQAVGFLQDEAESLGKRLSTFDETLNQINKAVAAIAQQDAGYQKTVDDLRSQMNQIAQTKAQDNETVAKLRESNIEELNTLHTTEEERNQLKTKLQDLESELRSMHALTRDLNQHKDQLNTSITGYQTDKSSAVTPGSPLAGPTPLTPPQTPTTQAVPAQTDPGLANITMVPNAVSGYVLDPDNRPLMDVVIVVKKKGGPPVRALKSNRVGQFAIVTPLIEGNYEVSFEKDGYHFAVLSVECNGKVIPPIKVIGEKAN